MTEHSDGAWPLSAAATQVLRDPRSPAGSVLALALKELVVVGARELHRPPRPWWRGRRVELHPGTRPVPSLPPLPTLDRALAAVAPEGRDLQRVVRELDKRRPATAPQLLDDARVELARRGLLEPVEHRLRRTGWRLTTAGTELRTDLDVRLSRLKEALRAGSPAADTALRRLQDSPGLVLLLDRRRLKVVDSVVRDARTSGSEISIGAVGGSGAEGVWLCDLADVSSAVDSSVDSSGDGGSSGGDGGGGGD